MAYDGIAVSNIVYELKSKFQSSAVGKFYASQNTHNADKKGKSHFGANVLHGFKKAYCRGKNT